MNKKLEEQIRNKDYVEFEVNGTYHGFCTELREAENEMPPPILIEVKGTCITGIEYKPLEQIHDVFRMLVWIHPACKDKVYADLKKRKRGEKVSMKGIMTHIIPHEDSQIFEVRIYDPATHYISFLERNDKTFDKNPMLYS